MRRDLQDLEGSGGGVSERIGHNHKHGTGDWATATGCPDQPSIPFIGLLSKMG